MYITSINPNVVQIPMVQTGCYKAEFDSTYPVHLNGIISQDEFQESIANINKSISTRKSMLLLTFPCGICIIIGIVLIIVGGVVVGTSRSYGSAALIGVGFGMFFLSVIICVIRNCITQARIMGEMQRAITRESMKYSTRSPTPCSWRLDNTNIVIRDYENNQRTTVSCHIIIEIGRSIGPSNETVPYQYNQDFIRPLSRTNSTPPPYNEYSLIAYCSQCGRARESSVAKFCSSCGEPFYI